MSETRIVYKYKLGESQTIKIPKDPQILKVDVQNEAAVLWVLVDPGNAEENFTVGMVFTGWPFKKDYLESLDYIGSTQITGIVQHWFLGKK